MTPQLTETSDGSMTLRLEAMDETYHSTHGALTEAEHVYIKNGFDLYDKPELRILEIGFGTGLNAIVTLNAFQKQQKIKRVSYTSLEKYPVNDEISSQLNYGKLFAPVLEEEYSKLHSVAWEKESLIVPGFSLYKKKIDLLIDKLAISDRFVPVISVGLCQ